MQYIVLIYSALNAGPTYGTPEFGAMMTGYMGLTAEFKANSA